MEKEIQDIEKLLESFLQNFVSIELCELDYFIKKKLNVLKSLLAVFTDMGQNNMSKFKD